ncbi:hypothetical protein [Pseudoxanthomonas sp. USHLN014]|uniref:hypothetical protein n=1 Tax=Pseudoxanthomonas sp. USHLN014 TaxID=3081297 RepID=UPI00301CF5B5
MTKDEVFTSLVQKFCSGNSVPVTQAVITRDEFNALFLALRDAKHDEFRLVLIDRLVSRIEGVSDEWEAEGLSGGKRGAYADGRAESFRQAANLIRSALKGE